MTGGLDHLWAGWRNEYVANVDADVADGCVFCGIFASDLGDDEALIVWRGGRIVALLNAYPYTSGHLLVMPERHVGELEDLSVEEGTELWTALNASVRALKAAYSPEGLNVGINLGRAGGAGVPSHFHAHVLPRWLGDTNFMTTVANLRVMPESLETTWRKLRDVWPAP